MATLESLSTKVGAVMSKIQSKGLILLCNILSNDESAQGNDGGVLPEFTTVHEDIPCFYEPKMRYVQDVDAGKRIPIVQYEVMLPREFEGDLIEIKAGDQIEVLENGDEPGKVFQVKGIQNFYGVYQMAVCDLPDEE